MIKVLVRTTKGGLRRLGIYDAWVYKVKTDEKWLYGTMIGGIILMILLARW